jgi:hypothetical protein
MTGRLGMIRVMIASLLFTVLIPEVALAQTPPTSTADYVLVSVILKHDQSRTRDEMVKLLEDQGFLAKFPPDGMVVESWYVLMGLGHLITVRVPPARLRDFNVALESTAWKVFRSEIYVTYDFKEIAKTQRERALKK